MTIKCRKCLSDKFVKNGKAPSGSQKYKCKECGYAFVENPKNAPISEEKKALIDSLLKEKLSLRGIVRSAKVSRAWLQSYVNKKYKNLPQKLEVPKECNSLILECDELWSFCGKKSNKLWVWVAQDRETKVIAGLWIGDRSHESAQKLWDSLPNIYKKSSKIYTDFWEAYKEPSPQNNSLNAANMKVKLTTLSVLTIL